MRRAHNRAGLRLVLQKLRHIQTSAIQNTSTGIADRDNGCAILRQQLRGDATRIAKSLNRHCSLVQLDAHDFAGRTNHKQATPGSGFVAAE